MVDAVRDRQGGIDVAACPRGTFGPPRATPNTVGRRTSRSSVLTDAVADVRRWRRAIRRARTMSGAGSTRTFPRTPMSARRPRRRARSSSTSPRRMFARVRLTRWIGGVASFVARDCLRRVCASDSSRRVARNRSTLATIGGEFGVTGRRVFSSYPPRLFLPSRRAWAGAATSGGAAARNQRPRAREIVLAGRVGRRSALRHGVSRARGRGLEDARSSPATVRLRTRRFIAADPSPRCRVARRRPRFATRSSPAGNPAAFARWLFERANRTSEDAAASAWTWRGVFLRRVPCRRRRRGPGSCAAVRAAAGAAFARVSGVAARRDASRRNGRVGRRRWRRRIPGAPERHRRRRTRAAGWTQSARVRWRPRRRRRRRRASPAPHRVRRRAVRLARRRATIGGLRRRASAPSPSTAAPFETTRDSRRFETTPFRTVALSKPSASTE